MRNIAIVMLFLSVGCQPSLAELERERNGLVQELLSNSLAVDSHVGQTMAPHEWDQEQNTLLQRQREIQARIENLDAQIRAKAAQATATSSPTSMIWPID